MKEGGRRIKGIQKQRNKGIPLISVITVVYNGEKHLERTIKSVLDQSYRNIEYIIIDGNSLDKTIEIIEKYEEFIDYWRSEPDEGISDAFNKGFIFSTGDFIAFLNADDWYEPDGVNIIVSEMNTEYAIYSGHVNMHSDDGRKFEKLHRSQPNRLLQTMRVAHPSTFVAREVFDKVGKFSMDYKYAMDYDFMLRAMLNGFEIKIVNQVVANMLLGGNSSDTRKVFKDELEVKNKNLGNKIEHRIWYYLNLLFHKPYVLITKILRLIGIGK